MELGDQPDQVQAEAQVAALVRARLKNPHAPRPSIRRGCRPWPPARPVPGWPPQYARAAHCPASPIRRRRRSRCRGWRSPPRCRPACPAPERLPPAPPRRAPQRPRRRARPCPDRRCDSRRCRNRPVRPGRWAPCSLSSSIASRLLASPMLATMRSSRAAPACARAAYAPVRCGSVSAARLSSDERTTMIGVRNSWTRRERSLAGSPDAPAGVPAAGCSSPPWHRLRRAAETAARPRAHGHGHRSTASAARRSRTMRDTASVATASRATAVAASAAATSSVNRSSARWASDSRATVLSSSSKAPATRSPIHTGCALAEHPHRHARLVPSRSAAWPGTPASALASGAIEFDVPATSSGLMRTASDSNSLARRASQSCAGGGVVASSPRRASSWPLASTIEMRPTPRSSARRISVHCWSRRAASPARAHRPAPRAATRRSPRGPRCCGCPGSRRRPPRAGSGGRPSGSWSSARQPWSVAVSGTGTRWGNSGRVTRFEPVARARWSAAIASSNCSSPPISTVNWSPGWITGPSPEVSRSPGSTSRSSSASTSSRKRARPALGRCTRAAPSAPAASAAAHCRRSAPAPGGAARRPIRSHRHRQLATPAQQYAARSAGCREAICAGVAQAEKFVALVQRRREAARRRLLGLGLRVAGHLRHALDKAQPDPWQRQQRQQRDQQA